MTSIDKLNKSFEFLKIPTQLFDFEQRKQDVKQLNKKDKINHLNLVHENITSFNVRQSDEFSRLLSLAIETFLVYFDDDDQDVYFVAEECLNKTIKALLDTNLTRFPADLYRFLRKNGPERSLRAALVRFAELCHLIKPHKCRIYVDFIIRENTLSKIANRSEESIQNVLVSSVNKICSAFCWSMSDNEIKHLIQSFLPNLSNESSINSYRRVSANCLSLICLYSRSPYNSYYNLHHLLLSLILPLEDNNNEKNKFTVWGVLQCFRFMIIHLAELDKSSSQSSFKSKPLFSPSTSFEHQPNKTKKAPSSTFSLLNLCQIYEICVYYLNNEDNRLVIASLECLQALLKLAPFKFSAYLTKLGLTNESFLMSKNLILIKKESSLIPKSDSNSLSLTLKLSSSMDSISTLKPNNQTELEDSQVENQQLSEDIMPSNNQYVKPPCKLLGSFYDQENAQIVYLIRLLAFKFLLNPTNSSNKLRSDQEVKILVKSIALDCCSSLLSINPDLIFKSLFELNEQDSKVLYIADIIDYINHTDDKMRTTSCLLIGQLINTILLNNSGDYESWLYKNLNNCSNKFNNLKIELLIDNLMRFIKNDDSKLTNNICKRFALSSFRSFLPCLVKSHYASFSLEILINLIHLKHSNYNLVKCELVDLLASIDFKYMNYTEQELSGDRSKSFIFHDNDEETNQTGLKTNPFLAKNTQERIINEVFLYLLGSDDSKVRLETARCLTRFVMNMNFYELSSIQNQNLLLSAAEYSLKAEGYSNNLLNSSQIDSESFFYLFDKAKSNQASQTTSQTTTHSNTSSTGFVTPTSILHGGSSSSKRQIKYVNSPLSSVNFSSSLPWLSKTNQILMNNFIQPFYSLIKYWPTRSSNTSKINSSMNKIVEHNLNYLVPILIKTLIKSIDKYQFLGCLECLDFIFQTYQPAIYYASSLTNDSNPNNNQQIMDLIDLLISFLRHPNSAFDLYTHDILLRLIGNLFCSLSWLNMKKLDKTIQQLNFNLNNSNSNTSLIQSLLDVLNNSVKTTQYQQSIAEHSTGLNYSYSYSFNNQLIKSYIDQLFVHCMRMLCVLACVIDDSSLPSNLTSNLSAGSTAVNSVPVPQPPANTVTATPNSQSNPNLTQTQTNQTNSSPGFIKSKFTNLTDTKLSNKSTTSSQTSSQSNQSADSSQLSSLPKTTNNVYLGFFQNSSHYLKLYEILKNSFNSYKKTANINSYDRFIQILKTVLNLLAQLLESSLSVHEIGPHLDELLLYLKIIFQIEPSCSVKCVTLCLKSLFSLNLAGLMFEYVQQQLNRMNSYQSSNAQNSSIQIPISGLSSVLSGSLTSLSSFNQQQSPVNLLNFWSINSKRQQSSLFMSIIQNNLSQFTKYMYSQSLMYKNDNLNSLQINPNANLINLGLDSIEYMSSTNNSNITSSTSQNFQSTTNQSSKTVAKQQTGFNFFSLLKKNKDNSAHPNNQAAQQQPLAQQDLKVKQKTELKTIGQYIKSFESIVIKSLRQYTLTTSVNLQTRILELLIELIFLKVDYCLLDSDKIFLDYVLKQFEYLEQKRVDSNSDENENGSNLLSKSYLIDLYESFDSESSIIDPLNPFDLDSMLNKLYSSLESSSSPVSSLNTNTIISSSSNSYGSLNSPLTSNLNLKQEEHERIHILIPKLFDFLILLSHEKKLSQPSPVRMPTQQKLGRYSGLLTIPEIMQLCDNLIASENSPHTHAIPALRPLVIDLFLNRTNEDSRELDMQHDVIMMTMLRLIQYPSVWPLLTIAVLKFKKDNEEKWKKCSRQICDCLFDSIKTNNANLKLKFNEYNGHELRAIRRYSQSYVPSIESLKLLFNLFNTLAPQVFRPIDFIILSLFESVKPLFNYKQIFINNSELNSCLCCLILHVYLLLVNSNEDQVLARLHHLRPQIVDSYKESGISMSSLVKNDSSRKSSIDKLINENLHKEETGSFGDTSSSSSSSYYNDSDEADFDLADSALFLSKFLLRSFEIALLIIKNDLKFNSNLYFSSLNLASTSTTCFLRDNDLNLMRDLNLIQHLISNYLIFLLYIVNSNNYGKISSSLVKLIGNKNKRNSNNFKFFDEPTDDKDKNIKIIPEESDQEETDFRSEADDFGFDTAEFPFKINKFILFKLSKLNPILSSTWQYFLLLNNYHDQEYWLLSLDTNPSNINTQINDLDNLFNQQELISSNSSSNNNSLNPYVQEIDNQSDSSLSSASDQLMSTKLLRSKIKLNKKIKSINTYENNNILYHKHFKYPTLNEQLFKHLSLIIYCDNITTRNQLDNTTALTIIIVNNLVDLLELASHESSVLDLFSTIHRSASASNLFIHSINSNWTQIISKKKLYLLHSCLKSVEAVHLSSSGVLLNLLIEKFFNLPYLSLVRYADHIACQRVEMMQSLNMDELSLQLNEKNLKILDNFFSDEFKYSYRHQRLIHLLEQLKRCINEPELRSDTETDTPTTPDASTFSLLDISNKTLKMSPSIDFFMLYINSDTNNLGNLDKEWFYNIVHSSCCYSSSNLSDLIPENTALKSKQCALILSNLDYSNCKSILYDKTFKLNILKECLLISSYRTQSDILKLPSALKQAKNIEKDFMHPLWIASTQFLFDFLKNINYKLPKPLQISLIETKFKIKNRFSSTNPSNEQDIFIYEQKLNDLIDEFDIYNFISPLNESINSYLKSIRQYACLEQELSKENQIYLIEYILFQISYINHISINKNQILTLECLNQSFMCIFNLLVDQKLLNQLFKHSSFSTLISFLIKDFYQLILYYFFKSNDENLFCTPQIVDKLNINFSSNGQKYTNDLLFNTITLETLLKLRFLITNPINLNESSDNSDTFRISSNTHQYLQLKSKYFHKKVPFNFRDLIEKIYIGFCRLPILDRFIRIPDSLWRMPGFKLEYSQFMKNDTSTLPPLEYLRDPHILKEHLKHLLLIGWTSRTQFEYEYVNMLTFFHNLSEDYYLPMSRSNSNLSQIEPDMNDSNLNRNLFSNLPTEEIKERNKCISLLIKGLSTWLIKSSLTPKSGNSLNSLYEQVSRNKYPNFLQTQIGKQYSQVKEILDQLNRFSLFTKLNSISISNNSNLLYMLDPTLIDDIDRDRVKQTLDFTQPQPADSLTNLTKLSTSLRQTNHFNLLFSTNIERVMLNNLPTNSDSYFYFSQISLEGILKFLGQWNKNFKSDSGTNKITTTIGESIQSLVNSSNLPNSTLIDEVSAGLIKVAEYLSEDTDLIRKKSSDIDDIENEFNLQQERHQLNYLIQRSFNRNNLDLPSVLRTVLDYYESFFKLPSIQLKLDIFKSILYLSNCLFDSKQQYESLLQKLQSNFDFLNMFIYQENDLIIMPSVNELIDESSLSLAIYAECLCRCCLHSSKDNSSLSSKDFERLNKLIENGLKSNSVAIKISTLHGLIYWLELITLGYLGNNTNETKILIDHLCKQVYLMKDINFYLLNNSRYISTLWSAVFYTIENCLDSIRDAQNFCSIFIKLTYNILNDPNTPYFLFYQLYMGLERFLLSSMVPSFEMNTIQRLFSSKLYDEQKSLCLISLSVTSLYASNQSKQINYWNDIIAPQIKKGIVNSESNNSLLNSPSQIENPIESQDLTIGYPQILELTSYPELQSHLLKVLEVSTNFLDRMKFSTTSKEASLYASILPKILCDFLPPHDLLNKLITEFLNSSQHPYPEAVAYVLYKCFGLLQEKGLQSQIKEWCLLSFSNFLQRTSIHESIWLTSCLLVSASQNEWLKSTFPFLLNRYCAFQTIDRAIFYMSVIEFCKQVHDKAQLANILNTLELVSKPNTPYDELIKLLKSKESDHQ